jgi:hypothetical protein
MAGCTFFTMGAKDGSGASTLSAPFEGWVAFKAGGGVLGDVAWDEVEGALWGAAGAEGALIAGGAILVDGELGSGGVIRVGGALGSGGATWEDGACGSGAAGAASWAMTLVSVKERSKARPTINPRERAEKLCFGFFLICYPFKKQMNG